MGRAEFTRLWPGADHNPPFPVEISPFFHQICQPLLDWARCAELDVVPGTAITPDDARDYALYTALGFPRAASAEDLLLIGQWQAVFFMIDSQIDQGRASDLAPEIRAFLSDIDRIIVADGPSNPRHRETFEFPHARAMAELWQRSCDSFHTPRWRQRFARHLRCYQRTQQWELFNRITGRHLNYTTFMDHRRFSTNGRASLSFIEHILTHSLPVDYADSVLMTTLANIAIDLIATGADRMSFDREHGPESVPNIITTLCTDLNTPSLADASEVGYTLWHAQARTLQHAARDFPRLLRSLDHDKQYDTAAQEYIDCVLLYVGGNLEWVAHAHRYAASPNSDPAACYPSGTPRRATKLEHLYRSPPHR